MVIWFYLLTVIEYLPTFSYFLKFTYELTSLALCP